MCVCVSECVLQIYANSAPKVFTAKMPYHKVLKQIFLEGEKTHAIPRKYTNLPTPLSYHDRWHFCGISLAISPPVAPTPTASCTWKLQVAALCCHRCSRNLRKNRGLDERWRTYFFSSQGDVTEICSWRPAAGSCFHFGWLLTTSFGRLTSGQTNIKTSSPDCNQTHVAWWRWEISPKSLVVKATAPLCP